MIKLYTKCFEISTGHLPVKICVNPWQKFFLFFLFYSKDEDFTHMPGQGMPAMLAEYHILIGMISTWKIPFAGIV
jgi:hypothetical protein